MPTIIMKQGVMGAGWLVYHGMNDRQRGYLQSSLIRNGKFPFLQSCDY